MTARHPAPTDNRTRLEHMLDSIVDYAIYMLDPDGRVASWNTGAERIQGYPAGEILGRDFACFFSEEDRRSGLPQRVLAEARTTGRAESEGWRLRKDGGRFWAQSVVDTIRSPTGELIGFAAILRDVTQRHQAQQALMENERQFRAFVEGVIDYAMYMLDPSGVITSWNAGAERIKGYTAGEIVGQHFSCFYSREDRATGLPARVLDEARREGRYEAEGWRLRKDGSRFWASVVVDAIHDQSGALLGFAKITRDATERQAAQLALRESERQFRLLVSGVTDYALFMLDPNGIVTNWNAGAAAIKGYSADEIIGQHFSRFYTEIDRAAGLPARALHTAIHEGKYEAEGWRVRKDGSLFFANVLMEAIRDEQGTLIGVAKITRDATERREAQMRLQKAQEQIARAQKMEALGQLTGGVAHDFNNLLMIVGGHIQRIKRLIGGDADGKRSVDAIEAAVSRGETLTRQLLTFSRRQHLSPTTIDLHRHVEVARAMLESSATPAVRLVASLPRDLWPVTADANELELALVNVAINARDAMPDGGVITVSAENVVLTPDMLDEDISGEFVALSVADTGTGIAADILPKVFEPFFTTKAPDKGTGLGLAQVLGFAQQSGGTVTVSSDLGRGTVITLYLPRAGSGASPAVPSDDPSGAAASGLTVLVVEDNPDVASATAAMLEQLGQKVRMATGVAIALQAMENGEPVDLVLSDIVMAGNADGIDLARAVRSRWPGVPVLLATGYSGAAEAVKDEFPILRKPYQLGELGRAVANLVGQRNAPADARLVRLQDVRKSRGKAGE